jgi:hypothetical protein
MKTLKFGMIVAILKGSSFHFFQKRKEKKEKGKAHLN